MKIFSSLFTKTLLSNQNFKKTVQLFYRQYLLPTFDDIHTFYNPRYMFLLPKSRYASLLLALFAHIPLQATLECYLSPKSIQHTFDQLIKTTLQKGDDYFEKGARCLHEKDFLANHAERFLQNISSIGSIMYINNPCFFKHTKIFLPLCLADTLGQSICIKSSSIAYLYAQVLQQESEEVHQVARSRPQSIFAE